MSIYSDMRNAADLEEREALKAQLKWEAKRERDEESQERHKGKECVGCQNIIKCPGKPRSVKNCNNYEERKK